jgi:hypothetical protein
MSRFRMPSAAELYALEQLARRERAKAQAEIAGSAAAWLKALIVNVFTKPYAARPKGMRHA